MKKADSVDLAAHQVGNGQELEFKKAKFLGVHTGVYRLGGLGRLPPGSRVTFAWAQDRCPRLDADAGVPLRRRPLLLAGPRQQKTVTAQHPAGGAQVREGSAVNLSVTADPPEPQGFGSVVLDNCGYREVTVWEREGDQWVERGSVSPQWGDGGLCPAAGAPFEGKLRTRFTHDLVVVDPGLHGCG
jgi:hypothetical protein